MTPFLAVLRVSTDVRRGVPATPAVLAEIAHRNARLGRSVLVLEPDGTLSLACHLAMADEGPKWAALVVTIGLAVSLVPIVLRVLPPLAKDATTKERDPDYVVTVVGLFFYVVVVAGVLVLLDIE